MYACMYITVSVAIIIVFASNLVKPRLPSPSAGRPCVRKLMPISQPVGKKPSRKPHFACTAVPLQLPYDCTMYSDISTYMHSNAYIMAYEARRAN